MFAIVFTVLALTVIQVQAAGETVETRIGKLEFTHDFANGYPKKETIMILLLIEPKRTEDIILQKSLNPESVD